MNSSNGQNKTKNILIGILAGVVFAIGGSFIGFWLVVAATGVALYEGGGDIILTIALAIGVIVGIVGGNWTYNHFSRKK